MKTPVALCRVLFIEAEILERERGKGIFYREIMEGERMEMEGFKEGFWMRRKQGI